MARSAIEEDDRPIGRVLSRREILGLLGLLGGSAVVAACAPATLAAPSATAAVAATKTALATAAATSAAIVVLPSCVVRPALTEGPYFVDEKLDRSDIRADPLTGTVKPGTALALTFLVSRVTGQSCTALASATVDVWHCDALGIYSDANDPGFGSTKGTKFLRGYQRTDANGKATFATIWPGWYQGRAVHIHFKIRTTAANGQVSDFTSQLFFDEALNDQIFALEPYIQRTGSGGRLRNAGDGMFQQSGGKLTIAPTKSGDGYAAVFDIGLVA